MTDTDILNQEQVVEIEARAQQIAGMPGVGQLGKDTLALCRTLRALRAQLQAKATLLISDIGQENTALREQLAEANKNLRIRRDLIQGWQRHVWQMAIILDCEALDIKVEQAARELQSRLAQVEKERSALRDDVERLARAEKQP